MAQAKPHIIFLVLDTHRAEHMSIYGYHKDTTPVLGAFAEQSTIFDWAIAPGQWTIPSHASMFTGLYPTVHQTTQSFTTLPDNIPTLAELLSSQGYHTVGFCNNPLVGVMDNGLKRGFDNFYNYGATFPDIPRIGEDRGLRRAQRIVTELLKNVSTPIERRFGQSPLLLKLATMPLFVPIWSRVLNFKGNTRQSLVDVADYLRYHFKAHKDRPLFMFINMMETHLPYFPPRQVVDRWVPYLRRDREAREFLQTFNNSSYRWMAPMIEPFSELQARTLRDVYDAEIAYQDHELRRVFRTLKRSGQLDNTMVVIVSDHGESHGDHDFMGHAFAIYNELVRVPLVIHYPQAFPAGKRVGHSVSARRVFHTILDAAGIEFANFGRPAQELSLARSLDVTQPERDHVVSEAYPPVNFINVMEMSNPEAIERFRVREIRRAIYGHGTKLMTVGNHLDEFFDIEQDPLEETSLLDRPDGFENEVLGLDRELSEFIAEVEAQRDGTASGGHLDYSNNPELLERLRGLGYIE